MTGVTFDVVFIAGIAAGWAGRSALAAWRDTHKDTRTIDALAKAGRRDRRRDWRNSWIEWKP